LKGIEKKFRCGDIFWKKTDAFRKKASGKSRMIRAREDQGTEDDIRQGKASVVGTMGKGSPPRGGRVRKQGDSASQIGREMRMSSCKRFWRASKANVIVRGATASSGSRSYRGERKQ